MNSLLIGQSTANPKQNRTQSAPQLNRICAEVFPSINEKGRAVLLFVDQRIRPSPEKIKVFERDASAATDPEPCLSGVSTSMIRSLENEALSVTRNRSLITLGDLNKD